MNGAALYMLDVLIWLRRQGAQVTMAYEGNEPLRERLLAEGIACNAYINPGDFDVALVNTLIDAPKVSLLAPHLPVVFWIHEGTSALANPGIVPVWHRALSESTRIVFSVDWQAHSVYRSFLQRTQPHRIAVVRPGANRFDLRNRPARDTMPHVLFSGSVYERKRPADLVDAVLQLTDLPMKCTLAGSLAGLDTNGPEFNKKIISRLDLIRLEGEVSSDEHMQNLYARANLFCLPSSDEVFPRAILEAACAGLPLALSDLPCHEGVWKHGIHALMHPVGATDMLHWNLRALATDTALAQRLRAAALEVAHQHSKEAFIKSMVSVLQDAMRDPLPVMAGAST
jgi:glycosyltransferase involved in cell wall biosynthesis